MLVYFFYPFVCLSLFGTISRIMPLAELSLLGVLYQLGPFDRNLSSARTLIDFLVASCNTFAVV